MKKKFSVAVWSCARLSSKRCPKKMLKNFCNTTLTDIFLSKLKILQSRGFNVFFAGYENVFKQKCKKYSIPFIQRTKKSANAENADEIYDFLKNQNFDYLLQVNACMPMLKVNTIEKFLKKCIKIKKPCFAVQDVNNYFLSNKNKPFNFTNKITTINTKRVSKIKQFAHCFYFFKTDYYRKNNWFWDWKQLKYLTIPKNYETYDIDTKEEFEIAKLVYKSKSLK